LFGLLKHRFPATTYFTTKKKKKKRKLGFNKLGFREVLTRANLEVVAAVKRVRVAVSVKYVVLCPFLVVQQETLLPCEEVAMADAYRWRMDQHTAIIAHYEPFHKTD
jgi:hypothetical protein